MKWVAAPLGILAMLQATAASGGALFPADPSRCHDRHEAPAKLPKPLAGCHAVLGCAEHRKVRDIT